MKTLRLPPAGTADSPNVCPSVCLAGENLLLANDAGQAVLIKPGEKGAVGGGTLSVGSGATYAFGHGKTLIRGGKFLYCIGSEEQPRGTGRSRFGRRPLASRTDI
jgi:hypothetical protein